MKKSRFSEQQIAFILKPAEDGATVEEVCRKAEISIQTYYRADRFLSLVDARHKCEVWRHDYNNVRPHNYLGNQTPAKRAFASGQVSRS